MSFDEVPSSGPYVVVGREKQDIAWVTNALLATAFGSWRTHEIIVESLRNSICVGLFMRTADSFPSAGPGFKRDPQIGFGRVVTDGATFSWLCDIVIGEPYRGKGYGKFLIGEALKRAPGAIYLNTRDAHALYEKFGFEKITVMRRLPAGR